MTVLNDLDVPDEVSQILDRAKLDTSPRQRRAPDYNPREQPLVGGKSPLRTELEAVGVTPAVANTLVLARIDELVAEEKALFERLKLRRLGFTLPGDAPVEVCWLVEDLIRTGDPGFVGQVWGPSYEGKTVTVVGLAMAVANAASEWFGFPINAEECGMVAYLDLETGRADFDRLVEAWTAAHTGTSRERLLASHLPEGFDLLDKSSVDAYIEALDIMVARLDLDTGNRVSLIVIDSLRKAAPTLDSELDAQDMLKLMDSAQSLGHEFECPVLLVHHASDNTSTRAAGSRSQRGPLQFEFQIANRKMTPHKAKGAGLPGPVPFDLVDRNGVVVPKGGNAPGSVWVRPRSATGRVPKVNGPAPSLKGVDLVAAATAAMHCDFTAAEIEPSLAGMPNSTLRRHLARLVNSGLVEIVTDAIPASPGNVATGAVYRARRPDPVTP